MAEWIHNPDAGEEARKMDEASADLEAKKQAAKDAGFHPINAPKNNATLPEHDLDNPQERQDYLDRAA